MLKQHKRKALPWLSGQVLVVGLCVGLGGIAWAGQGTGAAPVQVNAKPKEMAAPQYPRSAFEQGVSGEVLLRVEVDAQGRTGDIRVLTSTPAGVFDAASIAAAKQWTFEPALRDGKAVATALKIPMSFKLDDTGPGQ